MNARIVGRFFAILPGPSAIIHITKNTITGLPTGDKKFRHHCQQQNTTSQGVPIDFPNRKSLV